MIQLPDVTQLDRDDAAKLLAQVQKMVDAGMDGSVRIAGYNGDQQTDSLETYRQWLQEKRRSQHLRLIRSRSAQNGFYVLSGDHPVTPGALGRVGAPVCRQHQLIQ